MRTLIRTFAILLLAQSLMHARVVEYELTIAEEIVNLAGKAVPGMTINGGIPGPTLRFREGDVARIHVHNHLHHHSTSIHWHGLLVPNVEDGVPHVTTPPIEPGTTHTFEFPLRHSGTYWYHSHTHLQEQSGVYGSIVIEPRGGEAVKADREHVLVLSDWTNEDPHEVMRTLLRGSEYYAIEKGNQQSILGAARAGALGEYFHNQWVRMPPMDVSDVAYDAFLINGRTRSELTGRPGERIRLRVINAAAATYFYLQSATGPLTIVAADGPPVRPVEVDRLFIGMAETYDVIVTIPSSGSWEFRATAQDGSGHASAFIGEGEAKHASDPPKPDLYRMDHMLDAALDDGTHGSKSVHLKERPAAPYPLLRSLKPTTLSKDLPVRTIPLRLTGDMERYMWSFNGKTMAEESTILIREGEIVRIEMINDTMMNHPIHLHGHFFRLINGQESHAPLKHTVDLPPMGRRTIEFEANETGDWLFHCHLLYHMMTGMSRIFSYEDQGPNHVVNVGEHGSHPWAFWGEGSFQSHMSEGSLTLRSGYHDILTLWETGWQDDFEEFEYEVDLLYERYFDRNLRAFGGLRLTNEHEAEDRALVGINYRLPLTVWAGVSVDSEGDGRISLEKEFQLTNRLSAFTELEYDTGTEWEWSVGAEYRINKPLSVITQYHSEHGLGAGFGIRF